MRRVLTWLKIAGVSLLLLYLGDYLSLRFRIPKRDPLETVQIQVYLAIRLKGQKVEYTASDPETETCVHSLFPQQGYLPCWYVTRHNQKWVEVGMVPGLPEFLRTRGAAGRSECATSRVFDLS